MARSTLLDGLPSEESDPAGFDVREFARTAQGSLRDELHLASFAAAPLAPDVVAALATLAVLEGATMAHLRNVLVTHTHKDARVTAFLVTWAFEKFWIADGLRAIVEASRGTTERDSAARPDAATPRAASSAGRGPVRRAFAGFTQGWAVVGAHMTIGLVDDWMLGAAYAGAAGSSENGALESAIERIARVKARHTRFFAQEAHRRLAASPKAARLARRELRRTVWPLGSSPLTPADRTRFTRFAFGGDAGHQRAADLRRRHRGTARYRRPHGGDRLRRPRALTPGLITWITAGRGSRGVRHRQVHRDLGQRALGRPRPRRLP